MASDHDFDLGQQIAELRGVVVKGFEGVHTRQDITNGRLKKAEDRIEKIERKDIYKDGTSRGISISWSVVIALLGVAMAVLGIVVPIIFHHGT